MAKIYASELLAALHETAEGLDKAGLLDKRTMRQFDKLALTEVHAYSPEEIKALRERANVSQSVFARYLNVTTSLVSQWERGEKRPSGAALKLLALVDRRGLQAIA